MARVNSEYNALLLFSGNVILSRFFHEFVSEFTYASTFDSYFMMKIYSACREAEASSDHEYIKLLHWYEGESNLTSCNTVTA